MPYSSEAHSKINTLGLASLSQDITKQPRISLLISLLSMTMKHSTTSLFFRLAGVLGLAGVLDGHCQDNVHLSA